MKRSPHRRGNASIGVPNGGDDPFPYTLKIHREAKFKSGVFFSVTVYHLRGRGKAFLKKQLLVQAKGKYSSDAGYLTCHISHHKYQQSISCHGGRKCCASFKCNRSCSIISRSL
eukprot:CCRYP_015268-RB/>CCRYP_015268-RB protein AED:0.15 eAED:0.15 QI:0/0.85/0.87/1/0.14/0.12/8/6341/113